jgi:hypothetical protein
MTDGLEVDQNGLVGKRRPCSARPPLSGSVGVNRMPWLYRWLYGRVGDPHTASGAPSCERSIG